MKANQATSSSRRAKTRSTGLGRPRKSLPTLPTTASSSLSADAEPENLSQLHYYATLLQQLHVRHRNQHRSQLWFQQLGLLRRAVRDLLDVDNKLVGLKQIHSTTRDSAENVRRRFKTERELVLRREELAEWICEVLIPACYVRFSVLMADGDGGFANLGVVLVAAVAGLGAAIGLPKGSVEEAMESVGHSVDAGVESVKHQRLAVGRSEVVRGRAGVGQGEVQADMDLGDDFGTVVERVKLSEGSPAIEDEEIPSKEKEQDVGVSITVEAMEKGSEQKPESKAFSKQIDDKKRWATSRKPAPGEGSPTPATFVMGKNARKGAKRKKNAIDDLFEGFA